MLDLNKELLKTCNRICKAEYNWTIKNRRKMRSIFDRIESKGTSSISRNEKILLSEYFDIRYHTGKVSAYLFVLQELNSGSFTVNKKHKYFYDWLENITFRGKTKFKITHVNS